VDFARSKVIIETEWDGDKVRIAIMDDGPGFSGEILSRLGEPFVTSRRSGEGQHARGMGLGLFIAKTLLERSGAEITFGNQPAGSANGSGAMGTVSWPRAKFEDLGESLPSAALSANDVEIANNAGARAARQSKQNPS